MNSSTESRDFELVAGHPVLDLVNTMDWRLRESGTEELLSSYEDLLRFMLQSELMKAKQARAIVRSKTQAECAGVLVACRDLREAAAEVLYARVDERTPPSGAKSTLNRYFLEARAQQRLGWKAPRLRWEWLPSAESAAELPLWLLSLSAARLLLSDDMERVRACENDECRWLFVDTSKNHTRRWCDMKVCGNRVKARKFKARLSKAFS